MPRILRFIPLLALALLLAGCAIDPPQTAAMPQAPAVASASTLPAAPFVNAHAIIILRHADIDPAQKTTLGNQAPLLPRGQERAQEVVTALKDAGLTRIVTSTALRTQQTAAPLAADLHIKPETPVGHGPESRSGAALSAPAISEAATVYNFLAETAKPSDTILLVHHHSVIPSIMAQFGFTHEPAIDDATEFDRVYILLPDPEHHTYHLLRLRYGGNWSPK